MIFFSWEPSQHSEISSKLPHFCLLSLLFFSTQINKGNFSTGIPKSLVAYLSPEHTHLSEPKIYLINSRGILGFGYIFKYGFAKSQLALPDAATASKFMATIRHTNLHSWLYRPRKGIYFKLKKKTTHWGSFCWADWKGRHISLVTIFWGIFNFT